MASIFRMGGAAVSSAFDATAWFANWSAAGGIALVANDRLVLSRTPTISSYHQSCLNILRDDLLRDGGSDALKDMLLGRREGEASV